MTSVKVPVLIVGGGGCGLSSSSMLSNLGIEHVLVEAHSGTSILPKAHYLNQRSGEILNQHGLYQRVYKDACPPEHMRTFRYTTTLGGDGPLDRLDLGRPSIFGCNSDDPMYNDYEIYKRHSSQVSCNLPLIRLEPILRELAESRNPGRILFNHAAVDFKEFEDCVIVDVVNRTTGEKVQYVADYVIAADGGKTFGPAIGINIEGSRNIADVTGVHFKADLSKYWWDGDLITWLIGVGNREDNIGQSAGIFGADWSGLAQLGPTWGKHSEEWVINLSFGQIHGPLEDIPHETLKGFIREKVNIPDLEIEILKPSRWNIEGIWATQYQTKRIFLAGDAVHRHPPTTGLGLNTAFGDAHNITWKLAAVLKGQAPPALLESYETERAPVGKRVAQWALFTFMNVRQIDTAIGLIPGGKELRAINEKQFQELAGDDYMNKVRRVAIAKAIESHRVEYAAHDLEIGSIYTTGALVPDGTAAPPVDPRGFEYIPTTRPGHRLPHAWLRNSESQRLSTHDLLNSNGGWALLTDDSEGGKQWIAKAAAIEPNFGLKIKAVRIGKGGDFQDQDGQWSSDSGLGDSESYAVLVRPDAYVAFRALKYSDNAVAEFEDVCKQILGR
ncbi:hypothetical protein DL98DRAFT_541991 [Cadophora sp. DSE1049]|nr:hypothetical protein DL98DRAFT_541991 [Cadophora sp. DSE1049]